MNASPPLRVVVADDDPRVRDDSPLCSAWSRTSRSSERPPTARETLLHDGPLAELTEVFGGWWIVEAPDLDTALKHAAQCPGAQYGAVEVRPLVELG